MNKKRVAFLAPKTKGGTYYYFKDISSFLQKKYGDKLDIEFLHSTKDYIKLHFAKYDVIFSIIPFIFKPLRCKKYYYNLHGDYEIEKKNKGLGVKLLYLVPYNMKFANQIILPSYYLADKHSFREKFKNKISIIPNFYLTPNHKNEALEKNENHFLTITSFSFYEKSKGLINLGNVIKKLGEKRKDKKIFFTIVGSNKGPYFDEIENEFNKISFPSNVKIIWKGWINKKDLENEYLNNNTFLYWSYLDNYPSVILEALSYDLKVLVNSYESFKYFLNDKMLCENEDDMINKILNKNQKNGEYKIFSLNEVSNLMYNLI